VSDIMKFTREQVGQCKELHAMREQRKVLEAQVKQTEAQVRAWLGTATRATFSGVTVAQVNPRTQRSIDAEALRASFPEVAAQVTRTTEYTTLVVNA